MAKNNVIDSLVMASRANARAENKIGSKYAYFTLILFAMIAIGLLIALLFGTVVYKSINATRAQADEERSSLTIIANAIKYSDRTGAIMIGEGPEGESLVISENGVSGVYEVRFYMHDGAVVQEYTRQDFPYDPTRATKIIESGTFDVSIDDGIVSTRTDQGQTDVALRSDPSAQAGEVNG